MKLKPEIVRQLRLMCRDGATPARLVEHIRVAHGPEPRWTAVVMQYFVAAFGMAKIRVPNQSEDYKTCSERLSNTTADILHGIIQKRTEWDSTASPELQQKDWAGTLKASDYAELAQEVQLESFPELAHSLSGMDLQGREYIKSIIGTAKGLEERVLILTRLAERLQQQVLELEKQLEERAGQANIER